MFERKFAYFTKTIDSMDELFEATFSPLAATGRPLSKCGKCKRYMKYIALKPNRLHCSTCDETYALPLNGNIKLYRELRCPLDDFELVLYSTGSKGTGFPICPYCYNHPPFEDYTKGMSCNHCPHPTCPHSMVTNAVCPCPETENEVDPCNGALILDATSAPRWKLSCNECNIVSSFVDTVKSVTIVKNDMCECGSVLLKIEFRENQSREPMSGCIMCDADIEGLLTTRFAKRNVRARFKGGRRGKGGRQKHVLIDVFYIDWSFSQTFTTLLLPALCELQHAFEQKHMKETHQMEVADEVAFFKIHDLNKDGHWDESELVSMYGTERNVDPQAEHIQSIIKTIYNTMDLNKDGFISQDEYITNAALPPITENHEKKEKELKKGKKNKNKEKKQNKSSQKLDKDYEFVVPAKFRA
ncbi:unnamed protein product [Rhizopus stolonifer]